MSLSGAFFSMIFMCVGLPFPSLGWQQKGLKTQCFLNISKYNIRKYNVFQCFWCPSTTFCHLPIFRHRFWLIKHIVFRIMQHLCSKNYQNYMFLHDILNVQMKHIRNSMLLMIGRLCISKTQCFLFLARHIKSSRFFNVFEWRI